MFDAGIGHGLREDDKVIQIVDGRLFYVQAADGHNYRIELYPHINGAHNIVIEYDRERYDG